MFSITMSSSTVPATRVLKVWDNIKTRYRLNRSATSPEKREKTGRGTLLKTNTSPNIKGESVVCKMSQLRMSSSMRRETSCTPPAYHMARKSRSCKTARAGTLVGPRAAKKRPSPGAQNGVSS